MSAHLDHYTNILRYWRSVETFSLPDVNWSRADAEYTILKPGAPLPWENPQFTPPPENRRWKHTLYFHLVNKEAVITLLAKLTGSTEYRDPVPGETCLSALVLDQSGRPTMRSYAPVAFPYAIKLIRKKQNPELLTEELREAQEKYGLRFNLQADEEPEPITWPTLQKELSHLSDLTANDLPTTTAILCVSEPTSPLSTLDAPFLNSYFIQDLDTLIRHPQEMGPGLQKLLTPEIDAQIREDLLRPDTLLKYLHPGDLPPGRWPTNPAHGLYSAQMAALNIALKSQEPIGINGPPGTGKTTLLREVIVDIIVTRAMRLLKAGPESLFKTQRIAISDRAGYFPIDEDVFGNDGIVVASSNNNAIENISRELPQLKSVDRKAFPDIDYFSSIASGVFGEPAWGLVSAVLGRMDNRSAFVEKFWFAKGRNFSRYLREQADLTDEAHNHFKQTAAELTTLLEEYRHFQQNASAPDFTGLPLEKIHCLTPHSSEKINTLRSTIFLRSLELHEWAIRVNPLKFQTNLGSFVDLLNGRHREHIDEGVAEALWSSFFFCIPVVSVTLASFQRQFSKLGQGALGWLLLDEAGQATLPSIAGAVWRARRSIIIGDTRQIAPVVNIPRALDTLLRENYKTDKEWSPLYHSAQSLADRITTTGSWLDDPSARPGVAPTRVWTGIPLRAHRRCDEPMFSISNKIAYDGQMVQANPTANNLTLPASAWLDIRGFTPIEGHAIHEEIEAVKTLLEQLVTHEGKIFIISPFRAISKICYEKFQRRGRIECGTIHTFQGREADMVILVLGTLLHSKKARDWVSSTPNILNVAITRARHRLYVIGNRETWSTHPYFDLLARLLPAQP